jgi:N-acetyl-anhydromuramyl-L-alanine amidase AmpD
MIKELIDWYNDNVKFVGNECTNKSDRKGYKPEIIVDHISEGSDESCISWFTSKNNTKSSAHFLVAKDGKVYQFVDIERNAWANGLSEEAIPKALASIIRIKKANPNLYSVSIEHEGVYIQSHGTLTAEQIKSTIMLHRYISAYVEDKYGNAILFDREHILKHCEISPIAKPNCPGEKFPMDYIIVELNRGLKTTMNWKELCRKYLSDPEGWIKDIETMINAAEAGGDLGPFEKIKYFPTLIEKIGNGGSK